MTKGAKPDTWMPLVIGDYLKDTARLTTEQHGAYLLLIMDYWVNGPPADDDEELAAITKLDPKTWRKQRPKLERFFRIIDGVWRHKRIDQELAEAQGNSDKRAEKAAAAANARWERERAAKQSLEDAPRNAASNARSIARPDARRVLEECPAPSPSPIKGSVSDETGDEAPSDRIADLRELPVAKGCWRLAVLVLTEQGGQTEAKARSFTGKLKAMGLSDDELWEVCEAAWRNQTRDPVAYLTRASEAVIARRGSGAIDAPSERQQRVWMQDWTEKGSNFWRRHERGPYPGEDGCRVSAAIQREFGVEPAAADLIDLSQRRAG